MLHRRDFLQKCARLKGHCFDDVLQVCACVGRGFADLGFEEFLVMPSGKLLSLETGQLSQPNESESEHLFKIPTCDEMLEALSQKKVVLQALVFRNQREWELQFQISPDQDMRTLAHVEMSHVLMDALLLVCLGTEKALHA